MTPETIALGRLYQVRDDRAGDAATRLPLMSVSQYHGVVPRLGLMGDAGRADDLSNYKICCPGDLVLNRMSAYKGALGVAREAGLVSPDYLVLTPNGQVDADFLSRWLKTPLGISEMTQRLRGIGGADSAQVRTPRINHKDLRGIELMLPTVAEQRAIADYLDRETAQIDALIGKQERLIETLRERRTALISQVFEELSGGTQQLRRVISFLTSGSRGWGDYYADEGERFLRIGNLPRTGLSLRGEVQYVDLPSGVSEGERTRLQCGDLLFSITAYLGSVAVVSDEWVGAYVSQHVALCRLRDTADPAFVGWFMLSLNGQNQLKQGAAGGTKQQLSLPDIRELRVPLPALDEQRRIAAYLDEQTAKIDALIAKAERFIELSKERRAALITAAVTGQINVREAV
ncbi:restriction endonuclease subunit S [Nocardioides marmoraquaticus]